MDNKSVDNNIKSFFEQRTIQPSSQIWDRLDAMLTIAEKPKRRKIPLFLLVAASIIPIFLVCFWLVFNNDAGKIKADESLVISENHIGQNNINKQSESIVVDTPQNTPDGTDKRWPNNQISQDFTVVKSPKISVNSQQQQWTKNTIASDKTEVPVASQNISEMQKPDTEVTYGSVAQSPSTTIPPEKSDFPSDKPKNEMVTSDSQNKVAGTKYKYGIDPEKLLREAEYKSQQSFLSKVFKTLTEKSESVVTAVSTRNEIKAR